jgi:hypothetical protein
MTLLQIAGGQTWPNFLPLLGYKPSRVVFLTSADPDGKFAADIDHLRTALRHAGHDADFVQIFTLGAQPTLVECRWTLENLAPADTSLINLTGGTKTMTVAAWQFAKARGIPSFHLDTQRTGCPFDDFGTAVHPLPFPDLSAIVHRLNVRIALEAQGFPVPESFKQPVPEHLSFSVEAAEIRGDETADHEIGAEMARLRKALTADDGSKFLRKGKLRPALQNPIVAEPGTAWHRYLEAAARHDILRKLDSENEYLLVTLNPQDANSDDLHSQAETNFKLLEGIWFELALLERIQTTAMFSDIRWSRGFQRRNRSGGLQSGNLQPSLPFLQNRRPARHGARTHSRPTPTRHQGRRRIRQSGTLDFPSAFGRSPPRSRKPLPRTRRGAAGVHGGVLKGGQP